MVLKKQPDSRLECKNYTPLETKMAKVVTLFLIRIAEKLFL